MNKVMTRKEELERIARDYENKIIENNPSAESYDYMNAVIYGAECADRTMIDKVCEWLKENLPYSAKPPYQLIEDLRKAMDL